MKPKPFLVLSAIVLAATFDAGDTAGERADPRENRLAFRACIKKLAFDAAAFEREFVAAGFVGDAEIPAGFVPLGSVCGDPFPARTMLGQQVCKLMAERALDFAGGDLQQFRVENNPAFAPGGEPCGCPEERVPTNGHMQAAAVRRLQKLVGKILQQRIGSQAGCPLWLVQLIWRRADTPLYRTCVIQEQFLVCDGSVCAFFS